jgi:hypothetical protein
MHLSRTQEYLFGKGKKPLDKSGIAFKEEAEEENHKKDRK